MPITLFSSVSASSTTAIGDGGNSNLTTTTTTTTTTAAVTTYPTRAELVGREWVSPVNASIRFLVDFPTLCHLPVLSSSSSSSSSPHLLLEELGGYGDYYDISDHHGDNSSVDTWDAAPAAAAAAASSSVQEQQQQDQQLPIAYLVREGECSWDIKAQNVQALGGEYMILYNNNNHDDDLLLFPSLDRKELFGEETIASKIPNDIGLLFTTNAVGLEIKSRYQQAEAASAAAAIAINNTNTSIASINSSSHSKPPLLVASLEGTYATAFRNPNTSLVPVVIMKLTSALSFIGSSYIAISVFLQKRRITTNHQPPRNSVANIFRTTNSMANIFRATFSSSRSTLMGGATTTTASGGRSSISSRTPTLFLLSMSVGDMIASMVLFLGTWPVPATPGDFGQLSTQVWQSYFPLAAGTRQTCAAQGFFFQLGQILVTVSAAAIALESYLMVRYRYTDQKLQEFETGVWMGMLVVGFGTATAGACLKIYNPITHGFCWINRWPFFCNNVNHGETVGILGKWCRNHSEATNDLLYRFLFGMIWIASALLVIAVCMIRIFCFVREQERKTARWSQNANAGRAQRRVMWKAMWYVGSCLLLYTISFVGMFRSTPPLQIVVSIFLPLQGFINAIIYSKFHTLDAVFHKLRCCCSCCWSWKGTQTNDDNNNNNNNNIPTSWTNNNNNASNDGTLEQDAGTPTLF